MIYLEKQISAIKTDFDKIAQATGKAKEPEIQRIFSELGWPYQALLLLLNPMVVFHLGAKTFEKLLPKEIIPIPLFNDFFALCNWLAEKNSLTDKDIATVQWSIQQIESQNMRQYAQDFLCKRITLGVTSKTVNKALDFEAISEFRCMLANKYFEHTDKVEGRHFYLTEKVDGVRNLTIVCNKDVRMFTRQGQRIDGAVEIEAALLRLRQEIGKDFVLDGELLITDRENIPSKEQYKKTVEIIRTKGIKTGITYNVFDVLDLEAFERRCCDTPYYLRRQKLETYCSILDDSTVIKILPVLYHGKDTNQIIFHLNEQRRLQHEGIMINLANEPYQFTRTNALLKVKVMQDCDLEIVDMVEGTGKYTGTLGSLIVDYKGFKVGVGSGLSDAYRHEFWANKDKYIGRIATIQYFESTHDEDGNESLRFPVFKDICPVGKEVSYN